MTCKGRGNAGKPAMAAILVVVVVMVLQSEMCSATTYNVGDVDGWRFAKMARWSKGKQFKAGDVLVFKYHPEFHNVVVVNDGKSYKNCTTTADAKTYQTGEDSITLKKGNNFFFCGLPGHCQFGIKMAIRAL